MKNILFSESMLCSGIWVHLQIEVPSPVFATGLGRSMIIFKFTRQARFGEGSEIENIRVQSTDPALLAKGYTNPKPHEGQPASLYQLHLNREGESKNYAVRKLKIDENR